MPVGSIVLTRERHTDESLENLGARAKMSSRDKLPLYTKMQKKVSNKYLLMHKETINQLTHTVHSDQDSSSIGEEENAISVGTSKINPLKQKTETNSSKSSSKNLGL